MTMRFLRVIAIAVTVLPLAAQVPGPNYRFIGNGDFAAADWSDGVVWGTLWVSKGGAANTPGTYLYYGVYCWGSDGPIPLEYGYGFIPNADLKGDGAGTLILRTDTSVNPTFTREAGAGGLIALEFRKVNTMSSRVTGTGESRWGDSIYRWNGTQTEAWALVKGSVVGFTLPATVLDTTPPPLFSVARIGTNHDLIIALTRGK